MSEWNRCRFCVHYDEYEGCEWGCHSYEDYKPSADRIIAKAKEKGISVSDAIALIGEGAE